MPTPSQPVSHEISVAPGQEDRKPAALLAEASGLSQQRIKDAMSKGAVWLERDRNVRRLRRHNARLQISDRLYLYYHPRVLAQTPLAAELIADKRTFSVWNKPAGMLSHGSRWGDHTSITRFAETHLQRPTFLVHRLDRAASGLIVVAHGKAAAHDLTRLFEHRQVQKTYAVSVHGRFPKGAMTFTESLDSRPAVSHAKLVDHDAVSNTSRLEVKIETGRKHQIRRHLSAAGYPVVGDRLYGQDQKGPDLQLRAIRLAFELDGQHDYRLDEINTRKQV